MYQVDKTEMIALYGVVDFLLYIDDLINKTPKRTIANYIAWRFVKENSKYANDDLRNLHDQQSTQCLYLTKIWYVKMQEIICMC